MKDLERKFVSVRESESSVDSVVFDTEAEAREHAKGVLQYLTKREREQNEIYIADVVKDDLAECAFGDDGEIDWCFFEFCGHECYEVINKAVRK